MVTLSASVPTVNFTDDGPHTLTAGTFTRAVGIGWDFEPLIHLEKPCDYRDNNDERYYPVKTVHGEPQRRYQQYAELANKPRRLLAAA